MPPAAPRRPAARGFTRIDQPDKHNHGWFVRVGYYKKRDGRWQARYVAFFADARYGGKRKAMLAAESFVAKVRRADRAAQAAKRVAPRRRGKRKRAA